MLILEARALQGGGHPDYNKIKLMREIRSGTFNFEELHITVDKLDPLYIFKCKPVRHWLEFDASFEELHITVDKLDPLYIFKCKPVRHWLQFDASVMFTSR